MRKHARLTRVCTVALALVLLLAMTACQTSSPTEAPASAAPAAETAAPEATVAETVTPTEAPPEPVTLTLLVQETGTKWNNYPDSAVAQAIREKTGVTIQYVEADQSKYQVLIAGGDLTDIIRASAVNDGKQLIEGNLIIAMDDLLEAHGQNILKDIPTTVDYSRKLWSLGSGKLYFLPPQLRTAATNLSYENTVGMQLRWDYYKELGCPAIKTPDDLLSVLAQMQAKHPQTEDGKKIYGLSSWSDWGPYVYAQPMFDFTGEAQSGYSEALIAPPYQISPYPKAMYTDPDSNYWKMVEFMYKARGMGLLDPDALTMKNEDYTAKITAGQILYGYASWALGDFNTENAKNGQGFMAIPVENGYCYSVTTVYENPIGWKDKAYSISTNCKTPERAMDLLNYIFSYEGARTMYSGIEGVHWVMKDGIPVLTDETIAMAAEGGEQLNQSGISLDTNLCGFTGNSVNPDDRRPVDLFETQENFLLRLNALEKDYCSYYKVSFPGELFMNLIAEKKLNNYPEMNVDDFTQARVMVMSAAPDDIKKIDTKLYDMGMTTAAKAILAKSADDFAAIKAEAIIDFTQAGAPALLDWYVQAVKDARAAVGLK